MSTEEDIRARAWKGMTNCVNHHGADVDVHYCDCGHPIHKVTVECEWLGRIRARRCLMTCPQYKREV